MGAIRSTTLFLQLILDVEVEDDLQKLSEVVGRIKFQVNFRLFLFKLLGPVSGRDRKREFRNRKSREEKELERAQAKTGMRNFRASLTIEEKSVRNAVLQREYAKEKLPDYNKYRKFLLLI